MDDSSDGGGDVEVANQAEWVATMALLAKVDRAAYRKLRELAWKHARRLENSDSPN